MMYASKLALTLIFFALPFTAVGQATDHDHAAHDRPDQASHMIEATGSVVALKPDTGKIRIAHDPIPALEWPTMTMDFPVTEGVVLEDLSVGDRVQFTLHRVERGVLPVVAICKTEHDGVTPGLCTHDSEQDAAGMEHKGKHDGHEADGHGDESTAHHHDESR